MFRIVATAFTGTPFTAFWVRLTPSAQPKVSDLVPTSWTVTAEPRPSRISTFTPAFSK